MLRLWRILMCFFLGHKKYNPKTLQNRDFLNITEDFRATINGEDKNYHTTLVSVNICRRCGAVYSDYPIA